MSHGFEDRCIAELSRAIGYDIEKCDYSIERLKALRASIPRTLSALNTIKAAGLTVSCDCSIYKFNVQIGRITNREIILNNIKVEYDDETKLFSGKPLNDYVKTAILQNISSQDQWLSRLTNDNSAAKAEMLAFLDSLDSPPPPPTQTDDILDRHIN